MFPSTVAALRSQTLARRTGPDHNGLVLQRDLSLSLSLSLRLQRAGLLLAARKPTRRSLSVRPIILSLKYSTSFVMNRNINTQKKVAHETNATVQHSEGVTTLE